MFTFKKIVGFSILEQGIKLSIFPKIQLRLIVVPNVRKPSPKDLINRPGKDSVGPFSYPSIVPHLVKMFSLLTAEGREDLTC